jgi:GNAT superfamily N-acetyltransferase
MDQTRLEVRPFREEDVGQLHGLMMKLAEFEGYVSGVTERDLKDQGLCDDPSFEAFVAHETGKADLLGMAVIYTIPFTYTGRPNLVLKELFVEESARTLGVGSKLFEAVKRRAKALNCIELLWTIVPWNDNARAFYSKHGGRKEERWEAWICDDFGDGDNG